MDREHETAARAWVRARRALRWTSPQVAAQVVSELAILFASCELPFHPEAGVALALWRRLDERFEPFPEALRGDPEVLFADLVLAHPALRGCFVARGGGTGYFVRRSDVGSAAEWVEGQVERLPRGERTPYLGLVNVLKTAAREGWSYWEGLDLEVHLGAGSFLALPKPGRPRGVRKHVVAAPEDVMFASGPFAVLSGQRSRETRVFDLREWPPGTLGQPLACYVRSGGVGPDGSWVFSCASGTQRLRFDARLHAADLSPGRDLPAFDQAGQRVEVPLVGPLGHRCAGFSGDRGGFPLVQRGDALVQASLPGLALPHPVFGGTRGYLEYAGRPLLVFDGNAFTASEEGMLSLVLELGACSVARDWAAVLVPTGGLYFLSHDRLYELATDGRIQRHLPSCTNIMTIAAGPDGLLLLRQGENPEGDMAKVYDPRAGTLVSLPPELLGETPEFAHWVEAPRWVEELGALVFQAKSVFWLVPWEQVAGLAPATPKATPGPVAFSVEAPQPGIGEHLSVTWVDDVQQRLLYGWQRAWSGHPPKRRLDVEVGLGVQRDGALQDPRLTRPSGDREIDKRLLEAALLAGPFRPLPPGMASSSIELLARFGVA